MSLSLAKIDSAFHSIEIKDASGQALAIDGSGFLTANLNGALASITADVNIADGGNVISVDDAGGSLTVDGSVTVSATDLDIRDLSASQDNVAISDGTDTLAVNADGSINTNASPGGFGSWELTVESVGTTESELVSTPLALRKRVEIQNFSSNDIFIKDVTGVAVTDYEISKGDVWEQDLDANANIFAIAASGTNSIKVLEFA